MQLVFSDSCTWDRFPGYANAIVRQYSLKLVRQIDNFNERLWIVEGRGQEFSISWDDLVQEVTVKASGQTPDDSVAGLVGAKRVQKQEDGSLNQT